jgi:diguanylate cyclase (GGDEF)-like protein/PAS domain S-box-containing protein
MDDGPRLLKVLFVEDSGLDVELATRALKHAGLQCNAHVVETESALIDGLNDFRPDIILSDCSLPNFDGFSALQVANRMTPEIPFIFVSGTIGEERAIESLKRGATDYILKTNLARLAPAVHRALQDAKDRAAHERSERQLHETRERFELFMRHLPGAAFIKDRAGRYQFVNDTWLQITDRKPEEVIGRTDAELWADLDAHWQSSDAEVFEKNLPVQVFEAFRQRDGIHNFLVHKFPILDSDGGGILLGGIGIDFTERLRIEEKVARLSRIQKVLSGINSAIARIKDRQELFREACRIVVDHGGFNFAWLGMLDKETLDIRPQVWSGDEDGFLSELRLSARADVPEGQGLSGTCVRDIEVMVSNDVTVDPRIRRKEQFRERGYLSNACFPLTVEGEAVGVLSIYAAEVDVFDTEEVRLLAQLAGDISFALEYIARKEQLDYLAYYDILTGLPNRSLFQERLRQLVQASQDAHGKLALVVVDLRRFNVINETFGRATGDYLLKQVAERLRVGLPSNAGLARLGADTFGVVIPGVQAEGDVAHILEKRIAGSLAAPFPVQGQDLRLTTTCGVAMFPADGVDAEPLLSNAEAATKKAKAGGNGYLFYAPEMNARVAEKLRMENRLRIALLEDQFVLHYQPKVEIASGRIIGVEALIRWQCPEAGLVPPLEFVPLLEETGMIVEVSRWVARQAVTDYLDWTAQGLPAPRIAINVCARDLDQRDFCEGITAALTRNGKIVEALDFEITESAIMENMQEVIPKLRSLKEAGGRVAIDDFGTGYSSLSYIARLPIDCLKIDRSFITDMTDKPESMTIVSTIISLAHALNLKVTAEGVETQEQLQVLRLLRCDEMQGYLFSKPLPAAQLVRLLAEHKPH